MGKLHDFYQESKGSFYSAFVIYQHYKIQWVGGGHM